MKELILINSFFLRNRVPYPFQWGRPPFNARDAFAMMASGFVAIVEIESALPSLARPIMSLDANEDVVVDALKQSLEFGQPKACIEAKKKQPSNSDIQSSLKQEGIAVASG
ncbi:nucleobase-ascorbate transporter 4 [Quercus suber]|uniref:Nucleobase-ascorbate transporter 4 n=1 Tax=Quercus suber TaxID=58331 RepID=A0AAW0L171_QUESU